MSTLHEKKILADVRPILSAVHYERYARSEYERLLRKKTVEGVSGGLEEVKLRLFLSLLDQPPEEEIPRLMPTKLAANS